jgi:thiosulfate dehydrogenase [quinone] large subunit
MQSTRAIAYLLLRLSLGVVFLFFGVSKFLRGPEGFVSGLEERFSSSPLPQELIGPFGLALPFLEVTLGALLILGLFSPLALTGTGVLLLALIFGSVLEPSPPTVAHNVTFELVIFVLLWTLEHNRYSLDHQLGRGPSTASRAPETQVR